MRAGCPSIIERIEGGLLSYGNDMTRNDTPLECGLENYVNLESDHDFIGKSALKNQAAEGIKKHLVGVKFSGSPITPLSNTLACRQDNREVGKVTSGCYSPDFKSNLGIAMLDKSISASNEPIDILIGDEWRKAETAPIPFA
jgi:dimethylsulfoniopropionate demethylase